MKRVHSMILVVISCLLLTLFGCTIINTGDKSTDLMKEVKAAEQESEETPPEEALQKGINRFSAALFMASVEKEGNVLVSPASVYLALAMAVNGAEGQTKADILKVLADEGVTMDMVNKGSRDWIRLLENTGAKTTFDIANSIWFDQDFTPYMPFLQNNADFYAADARKLDFKDSGTPGVINSWVEEATKGTIEKIVEAIDPDVVMYLINTVYFKSDWQVPFNKNETSNQVFTTPEGSIETAFMHRNGKASYFTGNEASGVKLPYDDGQFAYFALLPDDEATPREWLSKQEPESLIETITAMMAQKTDFTVELAMPKFESRYEDSLMDELKALGMEIAFDPDMADFSQMNETHEKNLYISEIKHKTYIRVDEKGTEASAATSVEMSTTSMPVFDRHLTFDRPFIYGIMDNSTGMPLFIGIMEDPTRK